MLKGRGKRGDYSGLRISKVFSEDLRRNEILVWIKNGHLGFQEEIGGFRFEDEEPQMEEVVLGNKEESCLPEIKGSKQNMRLEETVGVALLLNTKPVRFDFILKTVANH